MKILCETLTINRQMPCSQASNRRTIKSTLAVGYHPPNKPDSELFLIHFSAHNKTGLRYKIKNNIEKVFTKFLNDGKVTISFKIPEHNLQIKCDPIQLKCFLRVIKLGLDENKVELNKIIGLSTLSVAPVSQKLIPITKMTILKVSDLPSKGGFPKSLKELQISTINFHRINLQILELRNLTKLNLSENAIQVIPKQIGELGLVEFNISSNQLSNEIVENAASCSSSNSTHHHVNVCGRKWEWLSGNRIRKTLQSLDLSNNELKYFPYNIVRLDNLVTLKLNNNKIKRIPFAIRRLFKLRFLYLNSNKLESVPHTLSFLRLEMLDVWNNNFQPLSLDLDEMKSRFETKKHRTQPLWVLAGQVVLENRIPYSASTIPSTLVDHLSEMPLCYCGSLCFFDVDDIMPRVDFIDLNSMSVAICSNRENRIYADSIFCSEVCFMRNFLRLITSS